MYVPYELVDRYPENFPAVGFGDFEKRGVERVFGLFVDKKGHDSRTGHVPEKPLRVAIMGGNAVETHFVAGGLRQFEHAGAFGGNGIPHPVGSSGNDRNVAHGVAGSKIHADDVVCGLVQFELGNGLTRY